MKIWKAIIAASVILAIAASAGLTASAMIPADETSAVRVLKRSDAELTLVKSQRLIEKQVVTIKALRAKNAALASKNRSLVATNKSQLVTIRNLQLTIENLTRTVPVPVPYDAGDSDCTDYLVCDPEQDCRIWGNNCHLVSPPVTEPPVESTPAPELPAPETPPTVTIPEAPTSPLPCASHFDPALTIDYPDGYDFNC